jgi:hypothetical protein
MRAKVEVTKMEEACAFVSLSCMFKRVILVKLDFFIEVGLIHLNIQKGSIRKYFYNGGSH